MSPLLEVAGGSGSLVLGPREGTGVKNVGIKPTWVQVIALPLNSNMILAKLLNLCSLICKLGNLTKLCLKYTWC